ncbi:GAF domain-containing protein [Aureibaculum sp. 2210JD6-5]|uniref:GAF domain-containing protein n=1 Tax=Aureibaculum sp. 2210JD6-5 TaxID=3103957 RepID=UPI002AACB240|nr:GAF domain-containing protein [Aureibaculum sp. 2210JD6-5]MDY7394955.1 GAF domain-containing protein [Aureibaculum sp. 2210JD6-5]
MKIQDLNNFEHKELPLTLQLSFDKVYTYIKKYADDKKHIFYNSANEMLLVFDQYPELLNGFTDLSLVHKYQKQIDLILDPLFPEPLQSNEIKAASIPFLFTSFKFSKRFQTILENAGEDYEFKIRNIEQDELYISSCLAILNYCYGYQIDYKRPFFFDIPNKKANIINHYRVAYNIDLAEIIPTKKAPKITDEDYRLLVDNFENIAVWKEKFPPFSYIFKGFGIMNLFDVTAEETVSSLKDNLLRSDKNLIIDIQQNLRKFYNINDLKIGFSIFDATNLKICDTNVKNSNSLILSSKNEIICDEYFCNDIITKVLIKRESFTISDVEKYGEATHKNQFYRNLKKNGIQSILLIPIKATDNNDLALLEIASPRVYELNSVNQNKLKDIIPVFKAAVKRTSEERQNVLEATIQEHYTSIHSSVKWRFYKAAENYQEAILKGIESPKLDDIVFKDVYPLYGQTDIKDSSLARSNAIKEDLDTQLNLAIDVLEKADDIEKLPIYEELMFRVASYLSEVNSGLDAGDEINILDFLKSEIYPVFNHIKKLNTALKEKVNIYMNSLDKELNVVYDKRKAYEESVTFINEKLADYLDRKQLEAQQMFPHYFERYKTDGVEFNMYIGQSLVNNKEYNSLYLFNLRLWQLQVMCELENIAYQLTDELDYKLRVASLILVQSNPMAIKFRMDEKQFDVDGAYNIRYEIIKKRIDKAHIKNTKERLTVPGKIAIVYTQDKDALEYKKYIKYLQSKKYLGAVEDLELEDLQGVSGLKALRAEIIYTADFDEKTTMTIDQLIEGINA